jgi:hypothetical protein
MDPYVKLIDHFKKSVRISEVEEKLLKENFFISDIKKGIDII